METESRAHDVNMPFIPCVEVGEAYLDSAPVRFSFEVDIPVGAERLFEVFEDPNSWPRWVPGIGHVEWTSSKPYEVGTTRTITFWGGMKVYEDFYNWNPPHSMAFSFYGTSQPIWRSFTEYYEVTPTSPDRCHLKWRVAYEPIGVFGTLHPMLKGVMRFTLGSYMRRLKRYCAKRG